MNAERRPREGGAGIGRQATPSVPDQAEMFAASRGAYGNVSIKMPGSELSSPERAPGPVLRDVGQRRAAQAHGGEPWLHLAEAWIETAAARGVRFTAETIRAAVGEPPSTALVGTAVKRAQVRGLIVADGVEIAHRPEAHGRLIRRWSAPSTPAGAR